MLYITLPLLRPFILFVTLVSTIGALQLFTEPYVFLGQSGTGSTRQEGVTMVTYLYNEAFKNGFFGTVAATAVLLFIATILFSVLNMLVGREGKDTGGKSMSTVAISRKNRMNPALSPNSSSTFS